MCHPVYGLGDCSEYDFCGLNLGRGACLKGKCVCANGFGGLSCNLEARCHFWDSATTRWSEDGLTTLRGDPLATGNIGASGKITCLAKQLPVDTTEYAALWAPIQPPSPPSSPPAIGGWSVAIQFTIAGAVNEFDQNAFEDALRAFSPGGTLVSVRLAVAPASVLVSTSLDYVANPDALAMEQKFADTNLTDLSAALGVTIESMSASSIVNLNAPMITLLPVEANPVFQTVLVILLMNIFSLLWVRHLRYTHPKGLLGPKRGDKEESPAHPTFAEPAALTGAAPAALMSSQPLALMGPSDGAVHTLPQLQVRFELEGDIGSFGEAQFIRRLATLIGVGDMQISATLSAGSTANSIAIDTSIQCPDATTLVMAAKTLKKAPGPLGLALGVRLLDSPQLTVPEEDVARPFQAGRQSASAVAESVAPTIQERIPSIGNRGLSSRRLAPGGLLTAPPAAKPPTTRLQAPAIGTVDWQFQIPGSMSEVVTGAGLAGPPAPPPLEGGIQERISFAGMRSSTRGAAALRMRSTQNAAGRIESTPPATDRGTPPLSTQVAGTPVGGVLTGLNLSVGELQESTPAGPPAVREGIQERLPAMPGMQRRQGQSRRATGEPRLRSQGSVAQALSVAQAPGAAPMAQPIQERVPRMARGPPPAPAPNPPPSPPLSPPAVVPSPTGKVPEQNKPTSNALVVKADARKSGAAFDMRLQTNPKVLPKGKPEPEDDYPETWDDRSVREILWGCAREHTLVGCIASVLLGDGPKLATVFQAVQLFWFTFIAILFLSSAQLRYEWMGPTWAESADKPSLFTAVGLGASLVGWPVVLVMRWLFLLANRTKAETSERQSQLIFGASWSIVLLTYGAFAVGAINMASNMDDGIVKTDVMGGFGLGMVMEWILIEPAVLLLFANIILLLKWCTSFEDLPEVVAENTKQQQLLKQKARDELLDQKARARIKGPEPVKEFAKK